VSEFTRIGVVRANHSEKRSILGVAGDRVHKKARCALARAEAQQGVRDLTTKFEHTSVKGEA